MNFILFLTLILLVLNLWVVAQTTRVITIPQSPPLPNFSENPDSNSVHTPASY